MENKYKERATKLLLQHSFTNNGRIYEQKEWIVEAMCQLAEEVEKVYKDLLIFGEGGSIQKVYSKAYVEELLQKQRELCVRSAKIYKSKQDYRYDGIDEDSILNAKLKID